MRGRMVVELLRRRLAVEKFTNHKVVPVIIDLLLIIACS